MKIGNLARLAIVAAMAMAWPLSAQTATEAQTGRAMVALSAKAADSKAKQDLLSILQPTGKFSKGNRVAVRGIDIRTIPHGTAMRDLCEMDELGLHYEPVVAKADPMAEPLRPVGLSVTHFYHARRNAEYLDDRYPTDRIGAIRNTGGRECEKLRFDRTATWFAADSAAEAVDAVNALHAALDALRTGKLEAKGCDYPVREGETCSQAILRVARLDKIDTLGPDCRAAAGQSCFDLFLDDAESMALTIVFSIKNNSPTPDDVIDVKAGVYVTVS